MAVKVTWRLHILCLFVSCIIVLPMNNFINRAIDDMLIPYYLAHPTSNIVVNFYIYLLSIFFITIIIHELIHGATFVFFGGKVKFGFRVIYAFTQEISGLAISRNRFIVVLISPLLVISAMCFLINSPFSRMFYFINFIGSMGDIIMSLKLLKLSPRANIVDRSYGYDVII